MRPYSFLLSILVLVALTGCGNETRASWEKAYHWTRGMKFMGEPGTVLVCYPDKKPVMNFGAGDFFTSDGFHYEDGMHVNVYDLNGVLLSHRWQLAVPLE